MVEALEPIRQIARRAPHEAAFGELVRRFDALPEPTGRTLLDEIEPEIARWPVETCRLRVDAETVLGPAARRLARSLELFWSSRASYERVAEAVRQTASVVALDLLPIGGDGGRCLALAPPGLRRVSICDAPARREAEAFAASVASDLARLEALDSITLSVGHATAHLASRVVARPLASFGARIGSLPDPDILDRLEPSTLKSLTLETIDGIGPAWTSAKLADVVGAFAGLTELTCPWFDPRAFSTLDALERLRVLPVVRFDAATDALRSIQAVIASLPATIRSLAMPLVPGDALVAAVARCPSLEEIAWLGSKLSSDGIRSLLASGALERLTSIELDSAVEASEVRPLVEGGAPRRLRNLKLGPGLGDETMRSLARSPAWLERLVSLDVQNNGISSKGIVPLLDVLIERAPDLVVLAVDGNRLGPDAYERLRRLDERGVAIDVKVPPVAHTAARRRRSPAAAVTDALQRMDAWLDKHGTTLPGLNAPATEAALAKAAHLPPSMRALYAAHDGGDESEVLGLGRIVWWRLRDVAREPPDEVDGRTFVVFAGASDDFVDAVYEPGDLPTIDDDDVDLRYAVATDTEEVVALGRRGSVEVVAQDLGTALEAVVVALETGKRTIDENGRLVDEHAADAASRRVAEPPATSPIEDFAAALVDKRVVELRDGASSKDLAAALSEAVRASKPKARTRAVLAVFDSALVEEVFADDDELDELAKQVARQFA